MTGVELSTWGGDVIETLLFDELSFVWQKVVHSDRLLPFFKFIHDKAICSVIETPIGYFKPIGIVTVILCIRIQNINPIFGVF